MDVKIAAVLVLTVLPFQTWGAQLDCYTGCPVGGSAYNLTCQSNSTGLCEFYKGSTKVMTCAKGGDCVPEETGYRGFRISDKNYVLQIDSLTADTFGCQLGSDPRETCTVSLITEEPKGALKGTCSKKSVIECSGLTSYGNPKVTLELKLGDKVLKSTTSGAIESTQTNSAGKTYTCAVSGTGAKCLSRSSVDVTCKGQCYYSPTILGVSLTIFLLANIACVVVLVIFCVHNKKIKFQLAFIIGAGILIGCGLGCTIAYFSRCETVTSVDKAAAAFSIIDILVGIIWIILAFVIKR